MQSSTAESDGANLSILGESDPRTRHLPLVGRVDVLFCVMSAYVLFTVGVGRRLLRNRTLISDAFLRWPMVFYNVSCLLLSLYVSIEIITALFELGYNWRCTPCVVDYSEAHLRLTRAIWLYYMTKYYELFDSILMVVRGKSRQLSALHIFHHSVMLPSSLLGLIMPGHAHFTAPFFLLNSLVHVLMYTYYALATFRSLQRYLFWKRYITMMQMGQFVGIVLLTLSNYVTSCGCSKFLIVYTTSLMAILLVLFGNFYYRSYSGKRRSD